METFKVLRVLCAVIFLLMVYRTPCANAISKCESQESTFTRALKGHTYDTFGVNSPDVCVKRCEKEKRCQSINFVFEEHICELNNRSMEARPDGYVVDPRRIYMTVYLNRVPLGSIPELPAKSCAEIKASEGEQAVNGHYWLDPYNTGKNEWTNCYLETKGSLFHWTLSGTDSSLTLRGAAKFVRKSGRTVLYLDGTQGTFAETSSVPFQKTDLTIAVWIFIKSPLTRRQEIYSDWSSPHQFRIGIEINGQLCFQGRRDVGGESDMMTPCTKSRDVVETDVWRHVAITWGRSERTFRIYINGERKVNHVVSDNPVLDFKNSGHALYDIGLKRDSGTTALAYFSDLVIFTHELSATQLKSDLFLNHPLHNFI